MLKTAEPARKTGMTFAIGLTSVDAARAIFRCPDDRSGQSRSIPATYASAGIRNNSEVNADAVNMFIHQPSAVASGIALGVGEAKPYAVAAGAGPSRTPRYLRSACAVKTAAKTDNFSHSAGSDAGLDVPPFVSMTDRMNQPRYPADRRSCRGKTGSRGPGRRRRPRPRNAADHAGNGSSLILRRANS